MGRRFGFCARGAQSRLSVSHRASYGLSTDGDSGLRAFCPRRARKRVRGGKWAGRGAAGSRTFLPMTRAMRRTAREWLVSAKRNSGDGDLFFKKVGMVDVLMASRIKYTSRREKARYFFMEIPT